MIIGYQGMNGSYSSLACKKFFKEKPYETKEFMTFKQLVFSLINEDVDYIALPVENSTQGPITRTIDLMKYLDVSAVSEIYVKVNHQLLGIEQNSIQDIDTIYSHPEALEQCLSYLSQFDHIEIKEYADTAGAAKMVSDKKNPNIAAIAGEFARDIYGLEVIEENVSDNHLNTTRFLIFKKGKEGKTHHEEKTSIYIETTHSTGSLNEILEIFNQYDINLLYLMSRPIPDKPFSYGFFIDVERSKSGNLTKSLEEITAHSSYLNILGTYHTGRLE